MNETDVLVRAQVQIKVLSPVHIGTGESLRSKSFVCRNGYVYVADDLKLVEILARSERTRADFESFCLSDQNLADFLTKQKVNVADVTRYSLSLAGTKLGRDLLIFVKTPSVPPQPYIPGSSIKGAVRSALLRSYLIQHSRICSHAGKLVRQKFPARKAKQADDALEQFFFSTSSIKDWQHYDWMRLLQFSDTELVPLDSLEVAEVYTFSLVREKNRLEAKNYVLSPEVLRRGTTLRCFLVINGYLTTDTADSKLGFKQHLTKVLEFTRACNVAAEEQIDQEIDFFKTCNRNDLVGWYKDLKQQLKGLSDDECLLRIGWGTGYDAKTVSDVFDPQTFDEIRDTYNLPVGRPGRRGAPLPKSLSPKSRKLAVARDKNGQVKFIPLGWIKLTVQ